MDYKTIDSLPDQEKFNVLLVKLEEESFVNTIKYEVIFEDILNYKNNNKKKEIKKRTEEEIFKLCNNTFKNDKTLVQKAFDIVMERIREMEK